MNEKHLATLEFPKVLDRLARLTAFSASRELALALAPSADLEVVQRRQGATAEAGRLRQLKANASVGGARDVRDAVHRAELGGVLDAEQLLAVASTLASARVLRSTILRFADELPVLASTAQEIKPLPQIEEEVARCLGARGEVLDAASPALAHIRAELRTVYNRLQERLHDILNAARSVVQEPIITMREGRYVIPIKAELKGQFRGIVHDASASGATLFIEPMAVVDLNNTWRELQLEEEREVERVLRRMSQHVGRWATEIAVAVERLAEIDLALAKARLAEEMEAVEPRLVALPEGLGAELAGPRGSALRGRPLVLRRARHPLLSGRVVPISVELGEDFFALIITGPNTGGKTVALKTIGLLALMAQAGLHVPADEGSQLPIFEAVYADIGDEQSIEQSLSTFSSHVTNIIDILGRATPRTLALLDELGAGTDPTEGSALARAILTHLIDRRVPTVATTHYSELKAYAHTTPGAQNASVEFDLETLSPTYRLTIGLPGRSNALAIAARLGMVSSILETARALIAPEQIETEQLLAQIQAERNQVAALRQELERERAEVARLKRTARDHLAEADEARQLAKERAWEEFVGEAEALREDARRLTARLAAATTAQDARQVLEHASAAVAETQRQAVRARPAPKRPRERRPLRPGDPVFVRTLRQRGQVLSLVEERGEAEVQLGPIKMRVRLADLVLTGQEGAEPPTARTGPALIRQAPVDLASQLDLRGLRAEDVRPELDRYLNDAYLAGLPRVRVVHGKGTGALRQVVREQLRGHPLVRTYETVEPRDGGEGVTVAVLAT